MPSSLRQALEERVLVLDGAMGTSLMALCGPGESPPGTKLCLDRLTRTHPERVEAVHEGFLAAGCDVIETNTFMASPPTLAEYGLAEEAEDLNRAAVALARRVALRHATPEKPRWVVGAVGPGLRLPSLGQVDVESLVAGYRVQTRALLEEGVDGLLLETCQDPLQIRAALEAALASREETGSDAALLVSVTVEINGRLLSGAGLEEVVEGLRDAPIDLLALNCATGPREMDAPLRELARLSPHRIGVYPNAGLPQMVDGRPSYALTPAELALWLTRFVEEDGVSLVGGCCGTTPEHLRAVVAAVGRRAAPPHPGGEERSRAARLAAVAAARPAPAPERVRAEHLGPRRIDALPLQNVLPFVDEERLFRFRWGQRRRGARQQAAHVEGAVRPRYLALLERCAREGLFAPAAVLGVFPARAAGERLELRDGALVLELPRQQGRQGLCLADFVDGGEDQVGLAAVTLGERAREAVRERFHAGDAEGRRELEGLAAELLEALAQHVHAQLRAAWGIAHEDARERARLLAGGYRGARFDFGSPPLPAASLAPVLELLGAERIGLRLEGERLTPALSLAFLAVHHPQARFFTL